MAHPRGIWIWVLEKIRKDYLDALQAIKCDRVYLKVFDDLSRDDVFWQFQCSPQLISEFNARGIEVWGWGYHFDKRVHIDVNAQVSAIGKAIDCGLAGYIFDVEAEVKSATTHPFLRDLLTKARTVVPAGSMGYTSFGAVDLHSEVPFPMLNDLCDLQLPQLYFEHWSGDPDKNVDLCLKAHHDMGLDKPILPIWSSEPNVPHPASAATLQRFLDRFPGSSLWRAPEIGETGEAWKLGYGSAQLSDVAPPPAAVGLPNDHDAPTTPLQIGDENEKVRRVQQRLRDLGYPIGVDGDFGPETLAMVKRFQAENGVGQTGMVGRQTWEALFQPGAERFVAPSGGMSRSVMEAAADIAGREGSRNLVWTGLESEAEKYLKPLRKDLEMPSGRYPWCGAFISWCIREAGGDIPNVLPGTGGLTQAFVPAWETWARNGGFWRSARDRNFTPMKGDLAIYDWEGDGGPDHIGLVLAYDEARARISSCEGNTSEESNGNGNQTAQRSRPVELAKGYVRLF